MGNTKKFSGWKKVFKNTDREKKSGEKKTAVKQSENKKRAVKRYQSISIKLIASFMLPVLFVIIIGAVSYNRASKAIISKYKTSSQQSLDMTGEYINFGFSTVTATACQSVLDKDVMNYFRGIIDKKSSDYFLVHREITDGLLAKQSSYAFIQDIHIISAREDGIISTHGKYKDGLYQVFTSSKVGSQVVNGKKSTFWIAKEEDFDKQYGLDTSAYAVRYVQKFANGEAYLMVDIKSDTLLEILKRLNFGTNSITGFVTQDGRELLNMDSKDKPEQIFSSQDFYKKALQGDKTEGSSDVTYQGEKYLFLYSKVGSTGSMVCSLVPEANIVKQVEGIKNITILLVILACIIAILVGVFTASGIQRIIDDIINKLKIVSQGDLTVKLSVKRKDEFSVLAEGINETIDNMRALIGKILLQSDSVMKSSVQINESSDLFFKAAKDIADSIGEIQTGVNQQAQDAENCLIQMDDLSGKIELVGGKTGEINQIATNTKQSINQGIQSMQQLNEKAKSTSQITARIIEKIETLEEKSASISTITGTINSIADATTLLSLNASIEAARAGEAGKGFHVVAQEIRKLADQSSQAVHEIDELVKDIQYRTKDTVSTAKEADIIVREQESAVNDTEESFVNMNQHVEKLIDNVGMISDSIQVIEQARVGTLNAIENISAVSQQTAAASASVNEITIHQMDAIDTLNQLSTELGERAHALGNAVDKFIVEK
jgi:methyl-accepting chemotaxis protein